MTTKPTLAMVGGEVPAEDRTDSFAERVRANIASRRQRLEELMPEAIDLAAEVLVALHRGLAGRQEALRGDRAGSVFRRSVRGDDSLPVEDLARLALEAPTALRPALAILAHAVGLRLEPLQPAGAGEREAFVDAVRAGSAVVLTGTEAFSDGSLSDDERLSLRQEVQAAMGRLLDLDSSLARKDGNGVGQARGSK